MGIGLLDPHGTPSVFIHEVAIHPNITESITYEISKRRLLQHWDDWNLTNMADWDKIDLIPFKRAQETITIHMAHFIPKCMSNTLPNMTIIHRQGHATINLCPRCGVNPEMIQHLYQCTHKGNRDRWTVLVDTLWK